MVSGITKIREELVLDNDAKNPIKKGVLYFLTSMLMKNKNRAKNKIVFFVLGSLLLLTYGFFTLARSEPTTIGVSTQSLKNNFSTIHFNA